MMRLVQLIKRGEARQPNFEVQPQGSCACWGITRGKFVSKEGVASRAGLNVETIQIISGLSQYGKLYCDRDSLIGVPFNYAKSNPDI